MRKVKVAQIGMSTHGHSVQVFASMKKQSELFDIAGYFIPEGQEVIPSRAVEFEGYDALTLEQIMNDPEIEAVVVESDEEDLTKYALMAAMHGKHVHMEKPGGFCHDEFEELISVMKKSGKVFHTGYMYRYNPMVRELISDVKSGKLGKILSVEAQMNCVLNEEVHRWLSGYPGGMMYYLGCHLIDLILQIQGEPENIIPLNRPSRTYDVDSEDFGMAVFEYPNGVSFAKTIASEKGGFLRRQLVVTGTKGTVELKPLERYDEDGLHTYRTLHTSNKWSEPGIETRSAEFDRYDEMMSSFAEMIVDGKENPYTYDYELQLHKTIMKCIKK